MKKALSVFLSAILIALVALSLGIPAFADVVEITEVYLIGFTTPEIGTAVEDYVYPTVPNNSGYQIAEIAWYYTYGSSRVLDGHTFSDTSEYYLFAKLEPLSGYKFANNVKFYINGSQAYVSDSSSLQSNVKAFLRSLNITPIEKINAVNIYNFTLPQIGQTAGDCLDQIYESDTRYSIDTIYWWNRTDQVTMTGSGVFEIGKVYYLRVELVPEDGYEFARDLEYYFDNSKVYVDTPYCDSRAKKVTVLSIDITAGITLIDTVNVSGFALPKAGDTVGSLLSALFVADDCNYSIEDAYWWRNGYGVMGSNDVFEAEKTYYLRVELSANEDCAFLDNVIFRFDGDAEYVDVDYCEADETEAEIYSLDYTIETIEIDTIDILGFSLPLPGETAGDKLDEIYLPDDCGYLINDVCWFESGVGAMDNDDVFESGKEYRIRFYLSPRTGYAFTTDADFCLNGETENVGASSVVSAQSAALYSIEYTVPTAINVIDVSGFSIPHTGDIPGDYLDLSLPDDCHYSIKTAYWYNVDIDVEMNDSDEFTSGMECFLHVNLIPDDGYFFAEDLTFYFDGSQNYVDVYWSELNSPESKKATLYSVNLIIADPDPCEVNGHSFDEWTVTTEPTCDDDGEKTHTCTVCGEVEVLPIDPLGHDYRAEVTEPTCTGKGSTTQTCTRCGDSYIESESDPLGHDYRTAVTEPTCTEKGYTTHTCARCGDSYTDSETDPLGHNFGEWTQTKAPTTAEAGEETRTCTRCDRKETRAVEKLPEPEKKKSSCKSTVGGVVPAVLIVSAAALALRKKKKKEQE